MLAVGAADASTQEALDEDTWTLYDPALFETDRSPLPGANCYRPFLPDFERLRGAIAGIRHELGIADIDRDEPDRIVGRIVLNGSKFRYCSLISGIEAS